MKKLFGLSLLLTLLVGCTVAKRTVYLTVPPERITISDTTVDIAEIQKEYADQAIVYLDYKVNYEHSGTKENVGIASSWTYTMLYSYKYLVLDNQNSEATTLRLPYKPDNLYIRTITPDHHLRTYGLKDLKEEKAGKDDENYVLIYPDIPKNTIVEVGYESTHQLAPFFAPMDYDIPLQFYFPCKRLEFKFIYPEWWELAIKEIAENYTVKYKTEEDAANKKRILSYTAEDIPAIPDEPFSPEFKEMAKYIEFMVTTMKMGMSSMDRLLSWDDMGTDFAKEVLNDFDKTKLNFKIGTDKYCPEHVKDLEAYVNNLFTAKKATTDIEKVRAIVAYVQDEIEMSWGGKKGSPYKIISQKEGNIYDVTALTRSMLRAAGYNADFLLVHSAEDGHFDMRYVDHSQIYTPAVLLTIDSTEYLLFPFIEFFPVDQIPGDFLNQKALVFKDKNSVDFCITPKKSPSKDLSSDNYKITVSEDGTILVKQELAYNGIEAHFLREKLKELDEVAQKDYCRDLLDEIDGEIADFKYEILNRDKRNEDLIIKLEYTIENAVMVTPYEILLQPSGIINKSALISYNFDKNKRLNPIVIRFSQTHKRNIEIAYPPGWKLTTACENRQMENIFGGYKTEYTTAPGLLSINQTFDFNQAIQPKEKYSEFLELYDTDQSDYIPALVFTPEDI